MKRLGELTDGIVQKALSDSLSLPDSPTPDVQADALLPVAVQNGGGFEALYQRAVEKGDVDTLARLMDLEERYIRRQAELAFNAAKGRILAELAGTKIVKNKWVRYEDKKRPGAMIDAFKYAPLEEIDKVVAPLLAQEQMDLSFSDEPIPEGRVLIRGRLKHLPGGHYEDSTMPGPLDASGGKSNIQAVGSTNSFLRRYITCNIFNIVVIGDDDDGIGGLISEEQVQELLALMKAASAGPKFLKYMHLPPVEDGGSPEESIAAMPARDYRKARKTLDDLIAKAKVPAR